MKEETGTWLKSAEENISSAKLLLENNLYNPCLQNCQQAIEKLLKSYIIERNIKFIRSHSIQQLYNILSENKVMLPLEMEEIELIDSIYLPSKYPIINALSEYEPTIDICNQCINIVMKVKDTVIQLYKKSL